MPISDRYATILVLLIAVGIITVILIISWRRAIINVDRLNSKLISTQIKLELTHQQIDLTVSFGQLLLEANDEASVIHVAMQTACSVLRAQGCSFLPFDEWRISLPALSHGLVPREASQSWEQRLVSPETRSTCKLCRDRQGGDQCVLLMDTSGPTNIRCLALRRDGREIGLLNLYFDQPMSLDDTTDRFLSEMVRSVELAFDNIHFHEREMTALQYLQTSHTPHTALPDLLGNLLESVYAAIGADFVSMWLPVQATSQAALWLSFPRSEVEYKEIFPTDFMEDLWRTVETSRKTVNLENIAMRISTADEIWQSLLVIPMIWREEEPKGMLVLGNRKSHAYAKRQLLLLQTVAGQTALMIQNTRLMMRVEYQAVLEERNRLAREIHDGLAQTLAFLKLEAGRMQNYASQGQIDQINKLLQSCYRTLSDAYLDARQAIDNLRRAPDKDLQHWLRTTADDFEQITGLPIRLEGDFPTQTISPKVHAQLIRIVQESLTNIRKHAQASQVILRTKGTHLAFILEIIDDGVGFVPGKAQVAYQHGLRGIRERADLIGAEFQITSGIGEGTVVRLELPLLEEEGV